MRVTDNPVLSICEEPYGGPQLRPWDLAQPGWRRELLKVGNLKKAKKKEFIYLRKRQRERQHASWESRGKERERILSIFNAECRARCRAQSHDLRS